MTTREPWVIVALPKPGDPIPIESLKKAFAYWLANRAALDGDPS